jgi:hypothetical protein
MTPEEQLLRRRSFAQPEYRTRTSMPQGQLQIPANPGQRGTPSVAYAGVHGMVIERLPAQSW